MAKKRITSRPGLFGIVYYYDEMGKYVGKSRPGLLEDTRVYFDEKGRQIGHSRPGLFWEEVYRDEKNDRDIVSFPGVIGTIHRGVGATTPGFFGREYTTIETGEEPTEEREECAGAHLEDWADDEMEDFLGEDPAEDLSDEEAPPAAAEDSPRRGAGESACTETDKAAPKPSPPQRLPDLVGITWAIVKWVAGLFCVICVFSALRLAVDALLAGRLVTAALYAACALLLGVPLALCLRIKFK